MIRKIVSLFDAFFDRVFAVIGALILSQAPLFFQNYIQRLSGHVDELSFQIQAMQQIAEKNGKSLVEYIQKFVGHIDPDFAAQGELLQEMLKRHGELKQTLIGMQEASLFARPFYFAQHMQKEIVQATFKDFSFGLSWSLEGLVYALVGIFLGLFVYHLCRTVLLLPRRLMFARISKK